MSSNNTSKIEYLCRRRRIRQLILRFARRILKKQFTKYLNFQMKRISNITCFYVKILHIKEMFEYLIEANNWKLWNWKVALPSVFTQVVDKKLRLFMSRKHDGVLLSRRQRAYFRCVHRELGYGNYCQSVTKKNVGCCSKRLNGKSRCYTHNRKSQEVFRYTIEVISVNDVVNIITDYI